MTLAQRSASSHLKLDLTDVTFVDAAGTALLRELMSRGSAKNPSSAP